MPFKSGISKGAAAAALVAISAQSGSAQAQTAVQFEGAVVASCVLSVSTPGILGVSTTSGTEVGTEQPGGVSAILSVTATAGAPTISFTAPAMTAKPAEYTGSPTVAMKYTSLGGANQGYTSSSSQYTSSNALGDTVTIDAKATDSQGFPAGTYTLQTTATCQQ